MLIHICSSTYIRGDGDLHLDVPPSRAFFCTNLKMDAAEQAVSIRVHLSSDPTVITGIFRHHVHDFMVREVQVNGTPVRYTKNASECDLDSIFKMGGAEFAGNPEDALRALVGDDVVVATKRLLNKEVKSVYIPVEPLDKDSRGKLHKILRAFDTSITSQTTTAGKVDVYGTAVGPASNQQLKYVIVQTSDHAEHEMRWPGTGPQYLQVVMLKRNTDTMDALDVLARHLHVPKKCISFAGNKDKRAITLQNVRFHKCLITASRFESFRRGPMGNRICLGDASYENDQLHLGDLFGNDFTIVIRNVQRDVSDIMKRKNSSDFVNYYGLQRFGTYGVCTSDIGIAMLKRQWKRAIELVFTALVRENPNAADAIKKFADEDDVSGLGQYIPPHRSVERRLLEAVQAVLGSKKREADGNNVKPTPRAVNWDGWTTALNSIQFKTRLLYVHAAQSLMWNELASRRMEMYGNKLAVGDLVSKTEYEFDDDIEPEDSSRPKPPPQCHIVSQSDIDQGTYTVHDLMLPLPGLNVQLPQNDMKTAYAEQMSKVCSIVDRC